METKEVAAKQATAVSNPVNAIQEMGFSTTDLMIAKILLMQSTSERVGDGTSALCDVINSVTGEKLGDCKTPIEIIPLKAYKTWVVFDVTNKQPEFMRQEPMTAANENLPWDDKEEGKLIRRDQSLNFYCLLAKEASSGEAFPVVVSFRRTSYQAGKILATHLLKMKMFGKAAFSKTLSLSVLKQKKETNTYGMFQITPGREVSTQEQEIAKTWLNVLSSTAYKVDDSDLGKTEDVAQGTAAPAPAPKRQAVVVGEAQEALY